MRRETLTPTLWNEATFGGDGALNGVRWVLWVFYIYTGLDGFKWLKLDEFG